MVTFPLSTTTGRVRGSCFRLQDFTERFGIEEAVVFIRTYGREANVADIHPNDRATLIHAARRLINGVPPWVTMH